jgi:hypothetical protein
MAFEKFKERHGGSGPFRAFYEAATGGHGIFGRLGLDEERDLTDDLISQVQNAPGLEGLTAAAEAGRGPMTREEHANFRAGLIQSALNLETANVGYEGFRAQSSRLRNTTVTQGDAEQLDIMDAQASYAHRLLSSADPALRTQGAALMGSVLDTQRQYAITNEDQRAQIDAQAEAGRDARRGEIQSLYDQQILGPLLSDQANFGAIAAQLEGHEGAEIASPAVTSAVLDYAGASLRQSDDGSFSFSIGPVGFRDKDVPTMTYSQLRNQLNQAYDGRRQSMMAVSGTIGELAKRQGFGINGTEVTDLLFPLADQARRANEPEILPPPVTTREATPFLEPARELTTEAMEGIANLPNRMREFDRDVTRRVRGFLGLPTNEHTTRGGF